jgi:hypothetical protein
VNFSLLLMIVLIVKIFSVQKAFTRALFSFLVFFLIARERRPVFENILTSFSFLRPSVHPPPPPDSHHCYIHELVDIRALGINIMTIDASSQVHAVTSTNMTAYQSMGL